MDGFDLEAHLDRLEIGQEGHLWPATQVLFEECACADLL